MQKISVCLWFDNQAEEAARFYASIFKNSKIGATDRYDEASSKASGQPVGSVLTVTFTIEGFEFMALNGGPVFKLTPAVSFFINCPSEEEIDRLWDKLSDGGKALMALGKYPFSDKYGWIQDKYGVSWQLTLSKNEIRQKVIPSLMFVRENCGRAEEAINFYTSIFKNARPGSFFRYEAGQEPDKEGTVAYADFELEGQLFAAMDSAQDHQFGFTEATSFVVNCQTQTEVDHYWSSLSAVPEAEQCGWLKDKFGVSWQIVPVQLNEFLRDPDPQKAGRAMQAMLKMKKLDIESLQRAYEG